MKKNKSILLAFIGLVLLSSCDPLKRIKFTQLPQSTLPTEMVTGRVYLKDISGGTWISNPQDILGTKIYVYYLGDSTYTYTSSRTYPRKVRLNITVNATPKVRVNGKAQITNTNDVGLFLSAFNLQNNFTSDKAADLVITDFNEATVNSQFFQDSLSEIKKNDTTEFLVGENGRVVFPNEIYYIRGVNITTVAMTISDKITNSSEITATVFKMNNSIYSSGTTSTFDYKIGLTVTPLFRQLQSTRKITEVINDKNAAVNPLKNAQQQQQIQQQQQQQLQQQQQIQKQQQQQMQQQIQQQMQQRID